MLYSNVFFKQGLIYNVVKNSDLPNNIDKKQKNELENIVVIISGDSNEAYINITKQENAVNLSNHDYFK